MSSITLRHLRLVQAIHRAGSLTRAGRRLGLSQPAVSRGLRELEDVTASLVFERSRSGVKPTAIGEILIGATDDVLARLDAASRQIAELAAGRRGLLRLATQCYTAYHWLPEMLARLRQLYPEIDVQVVPEATRRPLDYLRSSELDLAITHTAVGGSDLVSTPLFRDELLGVVAPTHRLARRPFLEAADFADEELILHQGGSTLFGELLEPAEVTPRRVSELQVSEAVLGAAMAGLGIAVLARWMVAPELRRKRVVGLSLGREGLWRTWSVTRRRGDALEPVITEITRHLERLAPAEMGAPSTLTRR